MIFNILLTFMYYFRFPGIFCDFSIIKINISNLFSNKHSIDIRCGTENLKSQAFLTNAVTTKKGGVVD